MVLLYVMLGILGYWMLGIITAVILVKYFHEEPDVYFITMCIVTWPFLWFIGVLYGIVCGTGKVVELITNKPFRFW